MKYETSIHNHHLLQWYANAGVDEAVDEVAHSYFGVQGPQVKAQAPEVITQEEGKTPSSFLSPLSPKIAAGSSRSLADGANTIDELEAVIRNFNGCALKKTASKTVFADGNPRADLMMVGEAPSADDDMQGRPFCGTSGQLLDRILAAMGRTRENVYITHTVFWRPPGNRPPTPEEIAICLPLVEKHIALVAPKQLWLLGGVATRALLQKDASISRLRSKTYEYNNTYLNAPIPTMVTFHPTDLLKSPSQKALVWDDILLHYNR
jgi:uracil-DNA glycosylase